MAYEKQTWANGSVGGTPLSAERLTHIEDGIEASEMNSDVILQSGVDYLKKVTIEDDGTPTASWPNRFEFKWKPDPETTVGEHLTAWFNEYGEFRGTPAKDNTVPFRMFTKELEADDEHDSETPVMEMVWCRAVRTPIWGVMADGTMYTSGPIERRVVDGPVLQTGYIVLPESDTVPTGTPSGTLIVRIPD